MRLGSVTGPRESGVNNRLMVVSLSNGKRVNHHTPRYFSGGGDFFRVARIPPLA